MQVLILILAYSALASATAYFLTVFAPDTNIDGASLNAAGQGFYSGTSGPATYCPEDVGKKCPEVQGTLVYSGMTGMAVSKPVLTKLHISKSRHIDLFSIGRSPRRSINLRLALRHSRVHARALHRHTPGILHRGLVQQDHPVGLRADALRHGLRVDRRHQHRRRQAVP